MWFAGEFTTWIFPYLRWVCCSSLAVLLLLTGGAAASRYTAASGRGYFAKQPIRQGTLLLVEKPYAGITDEEAQDKVCLLRVTVVWHNTWVYACLTRQVLRLRQPSSVQLSL